MTLESIPKEFLICMSIQNCERAFYWNIRRLTTRDRCGRLKWNINYSCCIPVLSFVGTGRRMKRHSRGIPSLPARDKLETDVSKKDRREYFISRLKTQKNYFHFDGSLTVNSFLSNFWETGWKKWRWERDTSTISYVKKELRTICTIRFRFDADARTKKKANAFLNKKKWRKKVHVGKMTRSNDFQKKKKNKIVHTSEYRLLLTSNYPSRVFSQCGGEKEWNETLFDEFRIVRLRNINRIYSKGMGLRGARWKSNHSR